MVMAGMMNDVSKPFEITGGEVVLKLNSSIEKKLVLPPQKLPWGLLMFVGVDSTTNLPSGVLEFMH